MPAAGLPIAQRRTVLAAWLDGKGFQLRLLPGPKANRYQLIPLTDTAKRRSNSSTARPKPKR